MSLPYEGERIKRIVKDFLERIYGLASIWDLTLDSIERTKEGFIIKGKWALDVDRNKWRSFELELDRDFRLRRFRAFESS